MTCNKYIGKLLYNNCNVKLTIFHMNLLCSNSLQLIYSKFYLESKLSKTCFSLQKIPDKVTIPDHVPLDDSSEGSLIPIGSDDSLELMSRSNESLPVTQNAIACAEADSAARFLVFSEATHRPDISEIPPASQPHSACDNREFPLPTSHADYYVGSDVCHSEVDNACVVARYTLGDTLGIAKVGNSTSFDNDLSPILDVADSLPLAGNITPAPTASLPLAENITPVPTANLSDVAANTSSSDVVPFGDWMDFDPTPGDSLAFTHLPIATFADLPSMAGDDSQLDVSMASLDRMHHLRNDDPMTSQTAPSTPSKQTLVCVSPLFTPVKHNRTGSDAEIDERTRNPYTSAGDATMPMHMHCRNLLSDTDSDETEAENAVRPLPAIRGDHVLLRRPHASLSSDDISSGDEETYNATALDTGHSSSISSSGHSSLSDISFVEGSPTSKSGCAGFSCMVSDFSVLQSDCTGLTSNFDSSNKTAAIKQKKISHREISISEMVT